MRHLVLALAMFVASGSLSHGQSAPARVARATAVEPRAAEPANPGLGAPLRPGDTFEINVSGPSPEYTQEFRSIPSYTVSENGSINVPMVGLLSVSGMTQGQLARTLEQRFLREKFFTMISVNVNVIGQSRLVTVGGSVRQPNAIQWSPDMTLSTAIKRAGGPTEFGNLKRVRVTRDGKTEVFNQKIYEKDPRQNPRLLPGDEVEVPE